MRDVRVEWNARQFSAAGRADCRRKLVSLNPRLREHESEEIERTLRHELAHLVARFRAKRRRMTPHGAEWRRACRDLGIGDEPRTHTLPFRFNGARAVTLPMPAVRQKVPARPKDSPSSRLSCLLPEAQPW